MYYCSLILTFVTCQVDDIIALQMGGDGDIFSHMRTKFIVRV